MEELFFWGEGSKNYKAVKGVPPSVNTILMDNPKGAPGQWSLYDTTYHPFPPAAEYKMPEKLYLQVPLKDNVLFDFIDWLGKVKIMSEALLDYFTGVGFMQHYEKATIATVFNRLGEEIETKKYYAIRFNSFDDQKMDMHLESKVRPTGMQGRSFLYPDMVPKEGVKQKLYILKELVYANGIIITKDVKEYVAKHFVGSVIYPVKEFHIAFNGK